MLEKMIDSYEFGKIIIKGRSYTRDVIILGDRILDNWWRKSGHQLSIEDLEEALSEKPDVLIVGTGHSGVMKVLPEVEDYLKNKGIELIKERTEKACKIFNDLSKSKKVVAALHLTC
ncbi:MAG: Mth938-like domain-containing protein [Candidatus Hydrothermarchaeota archaeon]